MASLKDIRKRIGSVKNTQKITKAMKLVAAAKLRRAQRDAQARRLYTDRLTQMLGRVAAHAGDALPALMQAREGQALDVVMINSNRGLCGSFNEGLARATMRFAAQQHAQGTELQFAVVGRKGAEALARAQVTPLVQHPSPDGDVHNLARELATWAAQRYLSGESSGCVIAFNRFYSAGRQAPVIEPVLPLGAADMPRLHLSIDYLYEPDRTLLMEQLVDDALVGAFAQALLDSRASEFAARMRAMDNATRNAGEMIGVLTLAFNRARQAAITNDLIDIIGGAAAVNS